MARAIYETKECSCGYRIKVEFEYCHEARMGVATAFYDADEFPGWPLPINRCPGCGAELIDDELEGI